VVLLLASRGGVNKGGDPRKTENEREDNGNEEHKFESNNNNPSSGTESELKSQRLKAAKHASNNSTSSSPLWSSGFGDDDDEHDATDLMMGKYAVRLLVQYNLVLDLLLMLLKVRKTLWNEDNDKSKKQKQQHQTPLQQTNRMCVCYWRQWIVWHDVALTGMLSLFLTFSFVFCLSWISAFDCLYDFVALSLAFLVCIVFFLFFFCRIKLLIQRVKLKPKACYVVPLILPKSVCFCLCVFLCVFYFSVSY